MDLFLFDDQPPLTPRSLEDQVYAAYALDDIHQAKILLLKLKGIEITSDDDPRIAAVQDEDFDICFIPNGRLISEEEEAALVKAQHREHKRRQRQERLRACEYVWDHVKRRVREERLWLQRRRDLEEWRKVAEETERLRALREREALAMARAQTQRKPSHRNVVSYETLVRNTSQTSVPEDPFVYDAMVHPSPTWNKRNKPSTPSLPRPTRSHSQLQTTRSILDDCRSVSFKEVLASMEGTLFPLERQCKVRPHRKHTELLDSLLQADWEGVEYRLKKGKGMELDARSLSSVACRRCSIDSPAQSYPSTPSSISSCPSLTRSDSWLSFASRSSDSTSPTSLPIISSWLKRPSTSVVRKPVCRVCLQQPQRVAVPLAASPLYDVTVDANTEFIGSTRKDRNRRGGRRRNLVNAANVVMNSLGHLMDAAKQLQRAYAMTATHNVAGLTACYDCHYEVDYTSKRKPAGMRVRPKDVKIFLGSTAPPLPADASAPVQYIPLISPFPPEYPLRTELPRPLPYKMVFKPHPPVSRSPFKWQTEKEPSGHRSLETHDRPQKPKSTTVEAHVSGEANLRIRLVSNPAYLRLKALENIIYERGADWEGHGRVCGYSSGKEILPGIAVEGLGRSPLSVC